MSFSALQFRAALDDLLPQETFRTGPGASGKAVWLHSSNLWTLHYVMEVGAVSAICLKDAKGLVDVSLFRDGIFNMEAVLKAVGALSV